MSESDLPTRPIVVELPPAVYDRLAELAEGAPVEELAAELLDEVARYGRPGQLDFTAHLAAQIADVQSMRWERRRAKLRRLARLLDSIAAELGQLTKGV